MRPSPELEPGLPGTGTPTAAAVDDHAPLQTLLCVEDNPANLLLIEKLIARRPGTRLLVARDAEQGVEIACTQLPDVVLMDINLPGMSGLQALKMLRADRRTSHMPVIALSANAMARDIEKGLHAGFLRYLTKPIKVNEFMETLDLAMTLARTCANAAALENTDNHAEAA
jgi:CheY-like chemotaxis protein